MRIVIALGGNALGINPTEQYQNAVITSKALLPLFKAGHEIIITHGNGPQVGLINLAFDEGKKINEKVYPMPFAECGAMSQGYIGYHLVNALINEGRKENLDIKATNVLTNVLVDQNDEAFLNPTKPIGSFYSKEEIEKFGFPYKEDSGRGYRRVVPSPKPIKIMEEEQIVSLIEKGYCVICCGGGGIPVTNIDNKLVGLDAVIDKDFASSKLASDINADVLLILTAVKNAKINFNTEDEKDLKVVSVAKITEYLNNNEFKSGSMKPKIEACLQFVTSDNRLAIITDITHASEAIELKEGTIIKYNA